MGEYADMAVDEAINGFWDYDVDEPDPYFHHGRWKGFRPRPQICKRCGKENLWWTHDEGGWYLEEHIPLEVPSGKFIEHIRHTCSLGFKQAFAKLRLDSDPDIAYNAYLDNIPWE